MTEEKEELKSKVRENYSQIASGEIAGCCGDNSMNIIDLGTKAGYKEEELKSFPEANQGLGCGNPKAIADLKKGETVIDLGCGGGFDVFLAAEEVGPSGKVIGVDMTPEMIEKARKNAANNELENVEFRLGEIEHLPVADNKADVIISNCAINLSVDKRAVYKEAYRVLKPGGRLAISDILKKDDLPEEIAADIENYSNCISGALKEEELEKILRETDFEEIEIEGKEDSDQLIENWSDELSVEQFIFSAYIRAYKPKRKGRK